MRGVFDTNILIDYLNGEILAKKELGKFSTKIISIITYMELLIGTENEDEHFLISNFLDTFEIQYISMQIANKVIELKRTNKIKLPDAIILATAICNDAMLITRNTKDFKDDGITIRCPYKL